MKRKAICLTLIFFLAAVPVSAATRYITDLAEFPVRSGPSSKYRVIKNVESGQTVEVLETRGEWTRISLGDDASGWVDSRYLTDEKPKSEELQSMREKLGPLENQIQSLETENQNMITMNQELADELEKIKKDRDKLASEFDSLKSGSQDFLNLKKRFDSASAELKKKDKQIEDMQRELSVIYWSAGIKWFLAGAGVLLIGMFIGSRSKRNKRMTLR